MKHTLKNERRNTQFNDSSWRLQYNIFLTACWILVPQPGIESRCKTVKVWSPKPLECQGIPNTKLSVRKRSTIQINKEQKPWTTLQTN